MMEQSVLLVITRLQSSTGTVTLDQTSVHSRRLDVKDTTNTSQSGFIKLYDNDNSNYIQLKSSNGK